MEVILTTYDTNGMIFSSIKYPSLSDVHLPKWLAGSSRTRNLYPLPSSKVFASQDKMLVLAAPIHLISIDICESVWEKSHQKVLEVTNYIPPPPQNKPLRRREKQHLRPGGKHGPWETGHPRSWTPKSGVSCCLWPSKLGRKKKLFPPKINSGQHMQHTDVKRRSYKR